MSMFPEIESELRRKQIMEEMEAIRLEEEAVKSKTLFDKNLELFGAWMISVGEKLRQRRHSSRGSSSVKLANKVA